MDFGADGKPRYLDVFGKIIDWDMVSRRYSATKKLLA
jgi:superoxide dismutase